jgi:hypothetical protein
LSFSGDDLYIGGDFENTLMVIDSSAVSVGPAKSGTDLFVAKMSTSGLLSIEAPSVNRVAVLVYPNPTNDVLYLDRMQEGTVVEVFSLNGQQVYSGVSNGMLHEIMVASWAPGMYVLRLRDQSGEVYHTNIIKS